MAMFPANLVRLHEGEEAIREESIRRIRADETLSAHADMIERALDLINYLIHAAEPADDDDLNVRLLGIRLFNGLNSGVKLLLSGYYQTATMQLRDVIETTFLLDYFASDRALITEWRTAEDKDRRKRFQPAVVRKALDARDRFTGKKRDAAYDRFCQLAAHPNPGGFVMLKIERSSELAHCGPFLEDGALSAVTSEAALSAAQAAGVFRLLISARTLPDLQAKFGFMEMEAAWLQQFFGAEPNQAGLDEMRELLKRAAAATP